MARPNVNTDDIYPGPAASPVLRRDPEAIGDRKAAAANLFAAWRYDEGLTPQADFVLNRAPYDRACILLGGDNFGCGSSRELAVWSLAGAGFGCVAASSFGDIFQDNCVRNGLLPARVREADMSALLEAEAGSSGAPFTVDLEICTIRPPSGDAVGFTIDAYSRSLLLAGHNEIDAALAAQPALDRFTADYFVRRPWIAL